jgi:hypothetical protein
MSKSIQGIQSLVDLMKNKKLPLSYQKRTRKTDFIGIDSLNNTINSAWQTYKINSEQTVCAASKKSSSYLPPVFL